ncbi:hypothetical protein [Brevibacillus laterosporus]|uniref:hypothetical protein n=1 Tax=Brevibacillus laterosporus TaxID=1465 RepID=UPI002E1E8E18|nr:hypothetical protein [Brevibacillus laterosporus]MED1667231.1 hypothetical protein [Brevibacillus laterosporus]MED1719701.1 hypothetical protein [Brevibacillus laterosporus]
MKTTELLSKIENWNFSTDQYAKREYNRIVPLSGETFNDCISINEEGILCWYDLENDTLGDQVILDRDIINSEWTIFNKKLSNEEKCLLEVIKQLDDKSVSILESIVIAMHHSQNSECTDQLIFVFEQVSETSGYFSTIGLEKVSRLMGIEVEAA